MKISNYLARIATVVAAIGAFHGIVLYAAPSVHYLITNNDFSQGNSATFYSIGTNGVLTQTAVVNTGGAGIDGIGAVATKRVSILNNATEKCAFISDAGSNDVAGISITTLALTGTFPASTTDSGSASGVGIVTNGTYLYANFTGSKTLATYQISSGCQLTFVSDVSAVGLSGGAIVDMSAHHNLLVVSFGDGSIESFDTSSGTPVANGDLQLSTGNQQDGSFPAGVDITSDGRYAIFGGTASPELVEVSDISSGKLSPTIVYSNIGSGNGSEAIWLSPDENELYLSNFSSSQVTAARFNKTTGTVSAGCVSPTLRGNNFEAGLATSYAVRSGGIVYVAEPDTSIGILKFNQSSGACTLTETTKSPAHDNNTITMESIGVFPPRTF